MRLETCHIDTDPKTIAALLRGGMFHSHQNGIWRYTPHSANDEFTETVYVNDPTEQFPIKASFDKGYGCAVCPDVRLYALIFRDGTRGMYFWDQKSFDLYGMAYGARDEGQTLARKMINDAMLEASEGVTT